MFQKVFIPLIVMTILIIIWQYRSKEDIKFPGMSAADDSVDWVNSLEDIEFPEMVVSGNDVDWDVVLRRLDLLREHCGDLCDTNKHINKREGDFLGFVTSKINCPKLITLSEKLSDSSAMVKPPKWKDIPDQIKEMYTYNDRVGVKDYYFDERSLGAGRNRATVWSFSYTQELINKFQTGQSFEGYPGVAHLVSEAADFINVTGKKILVIGSQKPWVEAILLTKSPEKIVTLEFGNFKSEYPGHTVIRPSEFRSQYRNKTLDVFDVVFSFSSLEHSGLGRYGDPLNPRPGASPVPRLSSPWPSPPPSARARTPSHTTPTGSTVLSYTHSWSQTGSSSGPSLTENEKLLKQCGATFNLFLYLEKNDKHNV